MNKFLDNTEYILWTLGISMLGVHFGLILNLHSVTLSMFMFMLVYATLLMMKSYMKKSL